MPTRTAFIITIGDVIDSGPPSRRNNRNNNQDEVSDSSPPPSPASSTGSTSHDPRPRPRRRKMKTRVSNTGGNGAGSAAGGNIVVNGNGTAAASTNGSSNGRRSRLQSVDQLYIANTNNNPLSPRTRSSVKQEVDDEVSFVDPLNVNGDELPYFNGTTNGENGYKSESEDHTNLTSLSTTAAITKKKRKSSAEKFLEDNSEYYGFQVLPSKLRSSSVGDAATASITSTTNSTTTATSSFPNPFLDFLHRSNSTSTSGSQVIAGGHHGYGGHAGGHGSAFACATSPASSSSTSSSDNSIQPQHPQPPSQIFAQNKQQQDEIDKRPPRHRSASSSLADPLDASRSRHSSGASASKRRIRANSSSSNHHNECVAATKKLRVEIEKMKTTDQESDFSDEDVEVNARAQRKKLRSRRGNSSPSPNSKKRRSELDKLLEAGSSSFHFETAKAATHRTMSENGLGPIHVDVSENSDDNSSDSASNQGSTSAATATKGKGRGRLLQEADVNQNSKAKKGRGRPPTGGKGRRRKQSDRDQDEDDEQPKHTPGNTPIHSPIIPDSMYKALRSVNGAEVDIEELEFSFERTPVREGWFQTYTRQDQGDEILYYPNHFSFPLPYEMPSTTFYPNKPGVKKAKRKLLSGRNTPSGTATPLLDEDEDSLPPLRTTRGSKQNGSNNSMNNGSGRKKTRNNMMDADFTGSIFDKLDPKKAAALRAELSRKSPRGHASTKSFSTSPYVDDDVFDEEIDVETVNNSPRKGSGGLQPSAYLDECSNDSVVSNYSVSKKFKSETYDQYKELAGRLGFLLTEAGDSDLGTLSDNSSSNNKKQRTRRQSSSEKRSKSRKSSKEDSTTALEDPIDRLVAHNVDPLFLDCLEDELPCVNFDDQLPGSDPMDLVNTFQTCTSISFGKKKKDKFANKPVKKPSDRSSSIDLDQLDQDNLIICHSQDPPPNILRRLLMSPGRKKKMMLKAKMKKSGKVGKKLKKAGRKKKAKKGESEEDDSSSESMSATETASVASMASSVSSTKGRKRRRNLTGFPSPKKRKPVAGKKPPGAAAGKTLKKAAVTQKQLAAKKKKAMATVNNKKLKAKAGVKKPPLKLKKPAAAIVKKPALSKKKKKVLPKKLLRTPPKPQRVVPPRASRPTNVQDISDEESMDFIDPHFRNKIPVKKKGYVLLPGSGGLVVPILPPPPGGRRTSAKGGKRQPPVKRGGLNDQDESSDDSSDEDEDEDESGEEENEESEVDSSDAESNDAEDEDDSDENDDSSDEENEDSDESDESEEEDEVTDHQLRSRSKVKPKVVRKLPKRKR